MTLDRSPSLRARRFAASLLLPTASLLAATSAAADEPPTPKPASSVAGGAVAPVTTGGLGVVAVGVAGDVAWPLAQRVYESAALRPASLDETRARILAGEPPPADASRELRDLAEMRAAVRGDDAPSRGILATLARSLGVRGLLVVDVPEPAARGGEPRARVFLAEPGTFDAARFAPDSAPPDTPPAKLAWEGAVASLARTYGAPASPPTTSPSAPHAPTSGSAAAPAAATLPTPPRSSSKSDGGGSHPFYTSGWFWGAVGAAAFGAGAVYFATRDNTSQTIHLQMQVPP